MFDKEEFIKLYNLVGKTDFNFKFSKQKMPSIKINLNKVIELDSNILFHIKEGKHTLKVKPSKLFKNNENLQECITNVCKVYLIKDLTTFKRIKGEKSPDFFVQNGNIGGNHIMRYDCMRYKKCQEYFGIFRKNPKQISVIYSFRKGLGTDNDISAFCVLYKINGQIFYDKIYGYNLEDAILLETNCIKKKYKFANRENYNSLQLENYNFNSFPYLDMFEYMTSGGLLYHTINDINDSLEEYVDFRDCNGGRIF